MTYPELLSLRILYPLVWAQQLVTAWQIMSFLALKQTKLQTKQAIS